MKQTFHAAERTPVTMRQIALLISAAAVLILGTACNTDEIERLRADVAGFQKQVATLQSRNAALRDLASNRLGRAMAVLEAGKNAQARDLLATIELSEPGTWVGDYAATQRAAAEVLVAEEQAEAARQAEIARQAADAAAREAEASRVYVTLDGYDGGELVVRDIRIWNSHADRTQGVAGTAAHGSHVELISYSESSDSAYIKTVAGVRGYVTGSYFIKDRTFASRQGEA